MSKGTAASGVDQGSLGGRQQSLHWQQQLATKNTFLDCPSPWIDPDVRRAHEEAESNRPSSDPTSNSSSRSNSLSSAWSSDEGKQEQRLQALERVAGEHRSEAADAEPVPMWTPGAEGHEERKCNPCMHYWKFGGCRAGAGCNNCHLVHDRKKKTRARPASKRTTARRRPPAYMRNRQKEEAELEAAGKGAEVSEASKDKYLQKMNALLVRAEAQGDSFDLDTSDFIPAYIKNIEVVREKFLTSLAESRAGKAGAAGSGRPASSAESPPGLAPSAAGRVADREDSSSDGIFSL